MNPNNVVGTPNVQAQPVAPAAPTAPAEPVASQPEVNPMTMGPKKSSKGGVIAAILFAVLAAGGIGFGVYTMMNSKKQEDALNDQIATLKKQNAELMEQVAEDGEDGEGSGSGAAIDTKDYIYVGEWGIKIKIPENLIYLDYQLSQKSNISTLCLNGGEAEDKNYTADGDILNIEELSIGCINRGQNTESDFSIGDYDFWYTSYDGEFESDSERAVFERVEQIIKDMLTNQDNYSAI